MDLSLSDQVVFVAGSSRGIGYAIAETLLAEGARVVLTGRDEAALRSAVDRLSDRLPAGRLLAIPGDLRDTATIEQALQRTSETFGHIDHVVASVGTGSGSVDWDPSADEWERLFEMNFFASARLAQAAVPHLRGNGTGSGSILFIASIAAVEATAAPLAYAAAKAALVNYAKNLSRRLGPEGIRVNTIAPGNILFEAGSWARHLAADAGKVQSMLVHEVPVQRFGRADEIATLAAYLCSPRAAFATGGCHVVDGGQTRRL